METEVIAVELPVEAPLEPEPEAAPAPEPPPRAPDRPVVTEAYQDGSTISGVVTRYGRSYAGQSLGCGTGVYDPEEPAIIAVGPSRNSDWPCGAVLRVCGPGGCIVGVRHDSCPGCGPYVIDLSEAGIEIVCGYAGASSCPVRIQRISGP
jgi:hypothetical protein